MQLFLDLLLLSPLFLFTAPAGWAQGVDFHWERTDRTADGWMNGTGSVFDIAMTPGGVILMSTPEGIFRIVEQTVGGTTDYVAEFVIPEIEGTMLVYSADGGSRSWHSAVDAGLRNRKITTYAVNDRGVIVAGTVRGGLYRTVGPSGVDEGGGVRPLFIDLW